MAKDPWLARIDWASGRVRDTGGQQSFLGLWIVTIFWNAIAWTVFIVLHEVVFRHPTLWVVLLFPIAGIGFLFTAIRHTWDRLRYGIATCELERVPIEPGKSFRGIVELRGGLPDHGFRITLNGERVPRMFEDETIEWQDEIVVPAGEAMSDSGAVRVPFSFVVPPDAHDSTESGDDDHFWRLHIEAGPGHVATFKLPVFRTGPVDDHDFIAAEKGRLERAARSEFPSDSGVIVSQLPNGGTAIHVRSQVRPGAILAPASFLVVLSIGIGLALYYRVPAIFTIIVGVIALVLGYGVFMAMFGRSMVEVRRGELRRGRRTISSADVVNISTAVGGRIGSVTWFDVYATTKDRSRVTLLKYLNRRQDADIVIARIQRALDQSS